jgi:Tfp pilus assembly protein PilF
MGSGKIDATAKPRVIDNTAQKTAARSVSSGEQQSASATIGAPTSESARAQAVESFNSGSIYLGRHEWAKAEQSFRTAISLDGSDARYHAALGKVMMMQHRWLEAQAAYSAAVLLDLDNRDYQAQLKLARSK